jgi:hypothetical protein
MFAPGNCRKTASDAPDRAIRESPHDLGWFASRRGDLVQFALLVEGRRLAPWHLTCLDRLASSAKLAAVVLAPADHRTPDRSRFLRQRLGATIVERNVDVVARFAAVPHVTIDSSDAALLETLDFALAVGRHSVDALPARGPRHGIWCFEHELAGEDLPFFREVTDGEDVTYDALIAFGAPTRDPTILEQGWFRTEKRSYAQELHHVLTSIADWPARACRRIAAQSASEPIARAPARSATGPATSNTAGLVRYGTRVAARRINFAIERVFRHPQWNVGIVHKPVSALLGSKEVSDGDIDWFPLAGRERFLADPFGVKRDGHLHVFCEEFSYQSSRGHIAALDWPEHAQAAQEALHLPVHASYPCLIEHDGKTYCVPETSHANEVALFEAKQFPTRWDKVAVLIDQFAGVDPTVFRHEGRWWLMCTEGGRDVDAALHVWHAPDLFGPWTPHTRNPVKTDVRSARPGGPPFFHEGSLYRAAQDCSKYYGWRVVIQRLNVLTPFEFDEETVAILQPSAKSPYPLGRHTFAPVGDAVLVDGHRRVFAWPAFRAFVRIVARDLSARLRPRAATR